MQPQYSSIQPQHNGGQPMTGPMPTQSFKPGNPPPNMPNRMNQGNYGPPPQGGPPFQQGQPPRGYDQGYGGPEQYDDSGMPPMYENGGWHGGGRGGFRPRGMGRGGGGRGGRGGGGGGGGGNRFNTRFAPPYEPNGNEPVVLMVAEKPSIAKAISDALCPPGGFNLRKGDASPIPLLESYRKVEILQYL